VRGVRGRYIRQHDRRIRMHRLSSRVVLTRRCVRVHTTRHQLYLLGVGQRDHLLVVMRHAESDANGGDAGIRRWNVHRRSDADGRMRHAAMSG
jgi:hypothetical protein